MKNINILFTTLCVIFLTSCFQDRIDLDLNTQENKKLVILGWLNDLDDNQNIRISYSQDYFSNEMEYIDEAKVTLSYDSTMISLGNNTNGYYLLPPEWKGEIGTEYTLKVDYNGEEYEAVSLLRDMPVSQNIVSEYYYDEIDSVSYYKVYFGFQETPGEGDGYFAIDYKKGSDQKNIIRTGEWTDDGFGDGEYFSDISVTSNHHQIGDTVILETHSIGKEATQYLESITTEIFREGFFDPAPVNVTDNFSNGAVGYFMTSGKKLNEVIIE